MMAKSEDSVNPEEVTQILWKHLRDQRPITLFNTFRGIPITYQAEVALVTRTFVGLVVHPFQTVGIKLERRTYLQSKSLPQLIRAHPVSIDYTNQVVLLNQLESAKSISSDLFNSWVRPKADIEVEITSDFHPDNTGRLLEVAVLDDNIVRAAVEVPEDLSYDRLDQINLAFRLPSGDELIQVHGIVHSLRKIRKKHLKRMLVEGKAAMRDEIAILAFIATREDEIMGALEKMYKRLRKGKKLKKK